MEQMGDTAQSVPRKKKHVHHRKTSHARKSLGNNKTNELSPDPCPSPGVQSPRSPGVQSPRSPGASSSSNSSRDSRSQYADEWSSDSGYSGNTELAGKSLLSLHFAYITVILCVLGYVCFLMLKMKQEVAESCKICDGRVLPEPLSAPAKKSPSYIESVDYASEEYGALIELHDTYHFIEKEFSVGDLLRLPNLDKVSPNAMLQDNDACFAMKGHTGTFIIRLSRPVVVQAITLVHNKQECDAAPREFIIYGVTEPKEKAQVSLGRFQYENRGKLAQKFIIPSFAEVGYVGLKIVSNRQ